MPDEITPYPQELADLWFDCAEAQLKYNERNGQPNIGFAELLVKVGGYRGASIVAALVATDRVLKIPFVEPVQVQQKKSKKKDVSDDMLSGGKPVKEAPAGRTIIIKDWVYDVDEKGRPDMSHRRRAD